MLAVLDVFISLAFIFGLFSVLVSAATELLMTVWSQRGRTLWRAVRSLLASDALGGVFLRHPLVQSMGAIEHDTSDRGWLSKLFLRIKTFATGDGQRASFPSYLPTSVFVDAIMHMLRTGEIRRGTVSADAGLTALIDDVAHPELRTTLQALHGSSLDSGTAFRSRLESWYQDGMDRATGWYKRLVHVVLFLTGFILAVWFNVDAIHIGTSLATNSDLRKDLSSKAAEFIKARADTGNIVIDNPAAVSSASKDANPDIALKVEQYNAALKQFDNLGIPWRWGRSEKLYVALNPFFAIVGWFISGLAASLGANFWFNVLGGLVKMRLTGAKPAPVPVSPAGSLATTTTAIPAYAMEPVVPPPGAGLLPEPVDEADPVTLT